MIKLEPGYYQDLPIHHYHADHSVISRSHIMDFIHSPYRYYANYLKPNRPEKKVTPAMIFGQAFHEFLLEPDKFSEHYAFEPEQCPKLKDVGRTLYDAAKTRIANFERINAGKHILKQQDGFEMIEMQKSCQVLIPNLDQATMESSLIWQDKDSGLMIKARPDCHFNDTIIDLKTTSDASYKAFQYSILEGGYHIQAAMMIDGFEQVLGKKIESFAFLAVEKSYPFEAAIYIIDDQSIEIGRMAYKEALMRMTECIKNQYWDSHGMKPISLPEWILNKKTETL